MFKKILIANRGDQLPSGSAATKSNRAAADGRQRGFTAGAPNV